MKMREVILEAIVRNDDSTQPIAVAFHNIFVHGDIFDGRCDDEHLGKLFDHLDGMLAVINEIEK